jgi:hypothetical protein
MKITNYGWSIRGCRDLADAGVGARGDVVAEIAVTVVAWRGRRRRQLRQEPLGGR